MNGFKSFLGRAVFAWAAVSLVAGVAGPAWGQRPNVLLVITDDQGWGDLSFHGNPVLKTPELDKLAAAGASFDRFFVSPVCAPTRASLLTGRYNLRTGVHGVTRGEETMRAGEYTLAEMFKEGGYATGCFGKWHNGAHFPHDPNGQGFDEFLGFCAGHWNNYFDTTLQHNQEFVETEGFLPDVLTDAAIGFMESKVAAGEKFFCYVSLNTPHSPWQVPGEYWDAYRDQGLDDATACAYAMCANIDANVGRMLEAVDRAGVAEDTLVIFLTDNGPNTDRFNGGMRGRKGSVDEGGVRVPLFMRWPRWIQPGTRVIPPAAHIDILPTLAVMCTLDIGETAGPLDGKSVAALAYGMPSRWPDRGLYTFRRSSPHIGAVRSLQWRAVKHGPGKPWQLYDILQDPGQERDVADGHSEVVETFATGFDQAFARASAAGFDPIPTEIGHEQAPVVTLPAHEAFLKPGPGQGIAYQGEQGWANDWITSWTNSEAFAEWPVKVVAPGRYSVEVLYRAEEAAVGSRLTVGVGAATAGAEVTQPFGGVPVPSPDRVPRKEVYEMEWGLLDCGSIELAEGEAMLQLRATPGIGKTARPEVKAVRLQRGG